MTEKAETKNTEPIVVTVTEKKCGKCGIVKPIEDFWKMRSSKDGLQPQCKDCQMGVTDQPAKKAEKKEKPAKKPTVIRTTTKAEKVDAGETEDNGNNGPIETPKKAEKKSKANKIGSGKRKECATCTYRVLSTEGGKCLSEEAEKDSENTAEKCPYHVQSKTAKKKAKKNA